jgi:hypothetical protein
MLDAYLDHACPTHVILGDYELSVSRLFPRKTNKHADIIRFVGTWAAENNIRDRIGKMSVSGCVLVEPRPSTAVATQDDLITVANAIGLALSNVLCHERIAHAFTAMRDTSLYAENVAHLLEMQNRYLALAHSPRLSKQQRDAIAPIQDPHLILQ